MLVRTKMTMTVKKSIYTEKRCMEHDAVLVRRTKTINIFLPTLDLKVIYRSANSLP